MGSKQEFIVIFSFSYLKAGIGEPWAGQVRAKGSFKVICSVEDFNTEENFGFALPIGSNKGTKEAVKKWWASYLKDGRGFPWAGQVKAILRPAVSSKTLNEFNLEDNLGLDPPIGSKSTN